jgi:hypothetical protein
MPTRLSTIPVSTRSCRSRRRSVAGLRYNLLRADEQGKKLLALESSARAEAFRLLLARVERAGEEARLAAEVNGL